MSYRRVLDNLTQGEQRNADRAARFDQNMITHERNRDLKQLEAIIGFSSSLDQFVQDKYKRDDAELQKDMMEEDMQDTEGYKMTWQEGLADAAEEAYDALGNKEDVAEFVIQHLGLKMGD